MHIMFSESRGISTTRYLKEGLAGIFLMCWRGCMQMMGRGKRRLIYIHEADDGLVCVRVQCCYRSSPFSRKHANT